MQITFAEAVGATLGLIALGGVMDAALLLNNTTAQGALIVTVTAAVQYFLRAKVQPSNPDPGPPRPPVVPHG